jgi:hypothetical protein
LHARAYCSSLSHYWNTCEICSTAGKDVADRVREGGKSRKVRQEDCFPPSLRCHCLSFSYSTAAKLSVEKLRSRTLAEKTTAPLSRKGGQATGETGYPYERTNA